MMRGFDSIESMNADGLLVKRKTGSKRFVIAAAILGGMFFLVGILIGYFGHDADSHKQAIHDSPSHQHGIHWPSNHVIELVNKDYFLARYREFSNQIDRSKSPGNENTAEMIKVAWISAGLDDVHVDAYQVFLSFPNNTDPNKVQLVNKTTSEVMLTASCHPTNGRNETIMPHVNAYSPAAVATGQPLYVNYGRLEDLQYLTNDLKINLTDKIFIARLGKIHYTKKLSLAEKYNASGLIMYLDPADTNTSSAQETEATDSWWLPSNNFRGGDRNTPGYPATANAFHRRTSKLAEIPFQVISSETVYNFLNDLDGQQSPASWHGNLQVTYHIGPGFENKTDMEVKLTVTNFVEKKSIRNIIGIIHGSEQPDRFVILGNQHDSHDKMDTGMGSTALTEAAYVFGQLVKEGKRPRRTIVFCSWDAESEGNIGSVEWIEENYQILHQRAVVYLSAAFPSSENFTLKVVTSPLIKDVFKEAAKKVPSPTSEFETFYDLLSARTKPFIGPEQRRDNFLSNDYAFAPFFQTVGISSCNMHMSTITYDLEAGQQYTSQDENLSFTIGLTQLWITLANDIANSQLLPLKVTSLASALDRSVNEKLEKYKMDWDKRQVNTDALVSSVQNLTYAATDFETNINDVKDIDKSPYKLRSYNDRIMQVERFFVWNQETQICKSSKCDNDDSRAPNTENEKWNCIKKLVSTATFHIQAAARSLKSVGL